MTLILKNALDTSSRIEGLKSKHFLSPNPLDLFFALISTFSMNLADTKSVIISLIMQAN